MPKMKISRLMFYSTVLTSVMLPSCSQHSQSYSAVENTASNYAQNAVGFGKVFSKSSPAKFKIISFCDKIQARLKPKKYF